MKCIITDIQRFSVHDGPGVRTTVFFKGCPLRCIWCHNPETNLAAVQPQLNIRRCCFCGKCAEVCDNTCHIITTDNDGIPHHLYNNIDCGRCMDCVHSCPAGALEISGKVTDTDEIIETVLRDRAFYGKKGGITLSGGEPTMQHDAANDILFKAKKSGLSTCVETCGYYLDKLDLSLCDCIYFDIKAVDSKKHIEFTGSDNAVILKNLRTASGMYHNKMIIRYVAAAGLTDSIEYAKAIRNLADECGIEIVEPLAFHPYGSSKAEAIGNSGKYLGKDIVPTQETMEMLRATVRFSNVRDHNSVKTRS